MSKPFFSSNNQEFTLFKGDNLKVLPKLNLAFDMVFADPPYFLSNNGLSIQSGKIVSVNKGKWDQSTNLKFIDAFNLKWLKKVRGVMAENATIWISGTHHNIFSLGRVLTTLDFKILNIVTWEKSNPPPNFSCRYFTHATEQIIWARKNAKNAHYFDYALMKEINGGKQMKDVWRFAATSPWEKRCGKHPTQKPLPLLAQLILASTKKGALVLDPFAGSATTGIAANLLGRNFVGIEQELDFLNLSKKRYLELENPHIRTNMHAKIMQRIGKT